MNVFLQNMGTAGSQVVILYIMVAVGFAADKFGFFTESTARKSNDLLFYVVTPCVIINSFLTTSFSEETIGGFLFAILCSVVAHGLGILLASPLFNKKKGDGNSSIYKYACIYGNVGYMALPLANAVLGETGVFYCSGAVIVFNTLCFTHGIWLMNKGNNVKFSVKSLVLNPGVISVIIGLPFFLFSWELPDIIGQPVEMLASMNTPLAMLIFGTYLANTDLKTMFKVKEQYLIMLVRLIAVPLLVFVFCKLMRFPSLLTTACIISASAPCAANTVMFAAKYDKDTALASKIVALVSFASVITLPMMIAISKQ